VWLHSLSGAGAGLGARSSTRSGFDPAAATDCKAGRALGKEHVSDRCKVVAKEGSLPQRVPLTQGCLVGWRVLLGRTLLRAQALEQVRSRLPERA
jgi:hypothetical protein